MPIKPYIDFKSLRERVSFASVLAHYRIELKPVRPGQLKGTCPLPTHTSGSKDTFFVDTTKNVWFCHSLSCQKEGRKGGNVIDFVVAMEHVEVHEAAQRLLAWFPATCGEPKGTHAERATNGHAPTPISAANKPLGFTLKDVNPEHPMIQSRGITIETAAAWGIGFYCSKQKTASMDNRVVFPLHEHGALVGYAGRATLDGQEPKWLFGKGLRKTFLFLLDRCDAAKPIVIGESLWAPLWFHQRGRQAASLMGSTMTPEQEECLAPFHEITVALDNDAPGNEKAASIVARLKAAGHRVLKARLVE